MINQCMEKLGPYFLNNSVEILGDTQGFLPTFAYIQCFFSQPGNLSLIWTRAGVNDLFTQELIDGASRCNYNQAAWICYTPQNEQ